MSTMILNLPKTALPCLNLTDEERNSCATYQLLKKYTSMQSNPSCFLCDDFVCIRQLQDEPPEMRDACLYDDMYNFAFPSNNLTLVSNLRL